MIRVNVSVADATVTEKETLTAGRVGLACAFTFSSEWDGLQKIAVFEGADSRSVALMESDETVVPWECMAEAGYKLSVGVVGKNAQGDIVIPTVWARVGKIQLSPDDVPEGEEPTPSVVAQIEQAAANALMLARSVKEAADNGEFDGAQGPQGEKGDTGDPAGISRVYVNVDNGTGTPFANAGVSGPDTAKQINFYFHNLKGPQGETGPAGEILSMSATVDNNTGTPSVGVTQMGTPSARRYALQFHNLKGAKGDKGDTGSAGPAGSTGPQGPVGPRGPAGVGVPAGGLVGQVLKKSSNANYATEWGDTGSSITVDDALSSTSENPVQNKVVKAALDGKGTYSKPSDGIPASDLAQAVQTSLGKADSALQSVPSTYRTAAAQDTIDAAQDTAIAGKLPTNGNAYRAASIPMGHLDSTSSATVMTATVPGITELRDGVCMWLRNGVITSAANFTLNINGLGAKPCYSSLAAASRSTTIFNVNYTLLFVFNSTRVEGGCWDIVYGVDSNTTYTPYSLGFGYGTCSTAADTAAKVANVSSSYKLVAGGIVAIKFDNDVLNNATLNINSKGAKAIYYKGAAIQAGTIKAGDTVTMVYSTYYHVLSIDHALVRLSDATPLVDYGDGDAGMSYVAARGDHVHPTDTTRIGYDDDALLMPMILNSGRVYLSYDFNLIYQAFRRQGTKYFFIPQSQYDYLLFTIARVDGANQTIYLSSIVGGILYQVVLSPDTDGMSGPLTTIDLNLQNAQGVSF